MNPDLIFNIQTEEDFNRQAMEVFHYQAIELSVYREFLKLLKTDVAKIDHWTKIPCLPVEFFKTHSVIASGKKAEISFSSSGTTGTATSYHPVADLCIYEKSFLKIFQLFYGSPDDYCILALLPAYLEREGSSLVYMADQLVKESHHPNSGFYLDQYAQLQQLLAQLRDSKQKTILLGVTFALLDMAEKFALSFPELIIMETGGMKGRRKEMIREEVHAILKGAFNVSAIHSEYGMTELLSQAYSSGNGIFECPPWMKILIRDVNDPFASKVEGTTGGINIIDLANCYSCAFIATHDLGKLHNQHQFEVIGRFDNSDLRGCNLLLQ